MKLSSISKSCQIEWCHSSFSGVQKCYHKPRRKGEPCSAGFDCGSGLFCEAGTHKCRNKQGYKQGCSAFAPCKSGLSCHPAIHKWDKLFHNFTLTVFLVCMCFHF